MLVLMLFVACLAPSLSLRLQRERLLAAASRGSRCRTRPSTSPRRCRPAPHRRRTRRSSTPAASAGRRRLQPSPDSAHRIRGMDAALDLEWEDISSRGMAASPGPSPSHRLASALAAGYAAAGTDDGHTGGTGDLRPGHHQQVIDFGFRALRRPRTRPRPSSPPSTARGRALVLVGCSDGGREALMEASAS